MRVADDELQRARTRLAAMREEAEAARRERRTSLGLDELKTPDEFVCPITFEDHPGPVCASDGHTYELIGDRGGAGAACGEEEGHIA